MDKYKKINAIAALLGGMHNDPQRLARHIVDNDPIAQKTIWPMISQDKELESKIKNILAQTAQLKENTMKLTKSLIKKLVMESLEESPVGGSPEAVGSMTTTNPMDNYGENGTFEELSDGTFRLKGKDGNTVDLSPEEMEKLVAQYEESKGYEGGHESAEPEAPVQEMGAEHLREGRVTKSGLQRIIKEEYRKLVKENDGGHLIDGTELTKYFNFDGKYSSPKGVEGGLPRELSGKFYVIVNGEKSKYPFQAYQAAEMVFKNPGAKLEKYLDIQPSRFSAQRKKEINW